MLRLSPLLLLLQLLSTAPAANAQLVDGECSCSPRQFFFKLDLAASCPALPPPFPPNDVFGAGVKDYTCTIGEEPIPNALQPVTSDDGEVPLVLDDEDGSTNGDGSVRRRRHLQSAPSVPDAPRTAADYFPELIDELAIEELEWSSANVIASQNFTTSQVSTNDDTVPVSIYSIQFLEVDTSFNVINQDSTYVRGIDFTTGDVFNYTSISKKSDGVVPGGMNMVLRGVNAEGQPVRNVFTITYTNSCDVATFETGEAIGWIVFENFEPASEETCNAPKITSAPATAPPITPFPTPGPDETTAPTKKPTPEPTKSPTNRPTREPSDTSPTTSEPTREPTKNPTTKPTREPSADDTPFPTPGMTIPTTPTTSPPTTPKPTRDPSDTSPSSKPTPEPTRDPSSPDTPSPTRKPSSTTKMPSHMSMPLYPLWSKSAKSKLSKSSASYSKTTSKSSKSSSKSSGKSSKSESKSSKADGRITSSSSNDGYSEVPIINGTPSSSSRSAKTAKGTRNGRNAEPMRDLERRDLQGHGHGNNQQHLRAWKQVVEEMELDDHKEGREHKVRNRRHLRR